MDVRTMLEKFGCIYSGHFVGVSTKHLAGYCNIDPLLPHVREVGECIKMLTDQFSDDTVEVVAAPAIGAIPFAHWGAQHIMASSGSDVLGVWADKVSGATERAFVFEREGFAKAVAGKKVLILEDMINQMASVKAMIKTVREAGGEVIGVGCIAANAGVDAAQLDVPKFAKLTSVEYSVWAAEDCQSHGLCARGVPIVVDIGHGDDYQATHPDYTGGYVRLLNE